MRNLMKEGNCLVCEKSTLPTGTSWGVEAKEARKVPKQGVKRKSELYAKHALGIQELFFRPSTNLKYGLLYSPSLPRKALFVPKKSKGLIKPFSFVSPSKHFWQPVLHL